MNTPIESQSVNMAVLGGGCFWCIEAQLKLLPGVTQVLSGYAGGSDKGATYKDVCSHRSNHAEVVKVFFDGQILSYENLLRVFFLMHDPTTKDQQGNDIGPQYRSILVCQDNAQLETAKRVIQALGQDFSQPIVTELVLSKDFYPAESEHQDYFARNASQPYCQAVISPKLIKLKKQLLAAKGLTPRN
jgi:methionine-S-sulfoxide reductase